MRAKTYEGSRERYVVKIKVTVINRRKARELDQYEVSKMTMIKYER